MELERLDTGIFYEDNPYYGLSEAEIDAIDEIIKKNCQ